jgi:hypothetical protein
MLLETLNYVLDNKGTADVILPIAKGFYFGDEEITEDYWNNIKFTIIWLKDLLEEDNKGASFYYRSSW